MLLSSAPWLRLFFLQDDCVEGISLTRHMHCYRSERRNVPYILVAEGESQTWAADKVDDYYEDEDYHPDRAWISAPEENDYDAAERSADAQDLYYLAMLDRFAQLQARLHSPAPLSAVELLTSSRPISFPPDAAKAREKWRHVTKTSDPSTTQLACMDPESVMELVKLLTECMSGIIKSRVQGKVKRLGVWIWATLARCRNRGELSSEEVAELRELGKRAVQLLEFVRRSQSVEMGDQTANDEDAAIHSNDGKQVGRKLGSLSMAAADSKKSVHLDSSEEDLSMLEHAKAQIASMLDPDGDGAAQIGENPDSAEGVVREIDVEKQIRMILDTTLTIVGEVYGQRDLLEHRDIWD